ncbi:hypothetical protein AB751O23_AD_00350 [Chlamydiales bacterium SCGC AB-751-O23]|nr:hypothetical protein AB751O23_AD_00350 [Chlamydiales bacterium SCGC AB-751-O23]
MKSPKTFAILVSFFAAFCSSAALAKQFSVLPQGILFNIIQDPKGVHFLSGMLLIVAFICFKINKR